MKTVKQILEGLKNRQKDLHEAIEVLGEADFLAHFSVCLDMELRLDELRGLEEWIRETENG